MKKHFVIIGIIAILVSVGLNGCTSQTNNENNNDSSKAYEGKIIGLWLGTNLGNTTSTFTFFTNGSCYFTWNESAKWITYSITDKTLTLIIEGVSTPYEYSISNNDNTLTIFGTTAYGENAVYTRH